MPARLWAISDIHITYKSNREAWTQLKSQSCEDGLILAGDVGEGVEQLDEVFAHAKSQYKHVWWVPGNHELYTSEVSDNQDNHTRGESKYMACVIAARRHGVLTPEDEYIEWEYDDTDLETVRKALICPIFTLYDYSFRPPDVPLDDALDWAMEEGIRATDEALLHPDPYTTRQEWCQNLVRQCEHKLVAAKAKGLPLVIINHWPLREDLVYIPQVPRFSIWCGTKQSRDWHALFNAKVVVSGHLHVRRTDWIDGVRFEECSLGYPKQWQTAKDAGDDINTMLREILPGPRSPAPGETPSTIWRQYGRRYS